MNWNQYSFTRNREVGVILNNNNAAQYFKSAFMLDWDRTPSTKHAPSGAPPELLITRVYYDSNLAYDPNEFVSIHNPTNKEVDMGGWYITDQQSEYSGFEATVVFPKSTKIRSNETIYVTKDAKTFKDEMGCLPDFEFEVISGLNVTHLDALGGEMMLANNGDEVFLKDRFYRIVDMVCWEDSEYQGEGWIGKPALGVSYGKILVRNLDFEKGGYRDTDSYLDWKSPREYVPGQSDFEIETFSTTGKVTAFVSPDCSYNTLTNWLNNSTRSVFLNVYQFHNIYLMQTLVNLSLRGIDVKVLIDGDPVGGLSDAGKYIGQQLDQAGCQVRYWISDRYNDIYKRYRFDHAKYCIVDNASVAVMSENWKLSGIPVGPDYGNRGWGIIVEDASLSGYLADVFFFDFDPERNDTIGYSPTSDSYGAPPSDLQPPVNVPVGDYYSRFAPLTVSGQSSVTPIISPDTSLHKTDSIIGAIRSAEESIIIQQMSCDLDWGYRKDVDINWSRLESYYLQWEDGETYFNEYLVALIDAARRGVEVKVLLGTAFVDYGDDEDNDDVVGYLNGIAEREGLNISAKLIYLQNHQGRAMFEKIHNKGMIIDDEKVLVSSINWVLGSAGRNREMGLLIHNREVATYFKRVLDFDWGLDIADTVSAEPLFSIVHTVENGTDTGYAIRIKNQGLGVLEMKLETVWLRDFVSLDSPPGFTATLEVANVTLGTGEEMDVILELETPEGIIGSINQSLGIRASVNGFYTDLVFVSVVVKNLTGSAENISQDDQDGDESKTNYTIPAVLGIVILILVIIIFALVRDKIKAGEEEPFEDIDDEAGKEDGAEEEERETEIDEDELDQLEPPDFDLKNRITILDETEVSSTLQLDEDDLDEDLFEELDLDEEEMMDEDLMDELNLDADEPDLD
jgi:phosphatidylserine/phosphatidylglycerophosphate/cardiolipin synthase-like enzyme